MKGAFIGFGNVAEKTHLPAYKEPFEIVAVCESVPERLETARKLLPRARPYSTTAELFAKERLDFVDICTPPAHHVGPILEALERGAHVLCEKPLVLKLEDWERVRTHRRDRVVCCVHNWKFSPQFIKIRELLGEVGPLVNYEWAAYRISNDRGAVQNTTNWRIDPALAGGGILFDHGWHAMYLAISTIGRAPTRVQTTEFTRVKDLPIEETVHYRLDFGDTPAHVKLSWAAGRRYNGGSIRGEDGWMSLMDSKLGIQIFARPETREIDFPEALSQRSIHPDWFGPVLEDFRQEIEDPGCRGRNLEEAGWCLRAILAAYESARQGSRIVNLA